MTQPALVAITPAGLRSMRWSFLCHINAVGRSISNYRSAEHPGLQVSREYDRKTRTTTRTYFVDGDPAEYATVEAAAKAWNDRFIRGGVAA